MVEIILTKDYSNKKKGHILKCDKPFANRLIALKVAKLYVPKEVKE